MARRESKADRFVRVAEARVNKIIKMMRLLGNCSMPSVYEFTDSQAEYIFSALQAELDKAKKRFLARTQREKKRFTLSDDTPREPEPEWYPTIVLALPDGTYLRAKAIDDENFPAINIYWDRNDPEDEGEICFAEYNPERHEGPRVCIGVYQSDSEDPKFYTPYLAERKSEDV